MLPIYANSHTRSLVHVDKTRRRSDADSAMRANVALFRNAHKKWQSATAQSRNSTCSNVLRTRTVPL
jgi:hypothetical protein